MSLTYDKAGRKKTMDDPDMGFWQYDYDALGNLKTQTDARGCVTNIAYDELNRPTGKTYAGCPTTGAVTYTYDAGMNGKGRRTSMSVTGADFTQWTYDARGRVTSENKQITGGGQFVTAFTYNSADLPVTMTYPDGEVLDYDYNNDMRLTSIAGLADYVQSIAYDSAGRMTQMTRGNGILTTTYAYFNWNQQGGRLQQLTTVRPSNQTTLQDFTYSYDSVGNIMMINDSLSGPQTQNFAYDALDRLISANATGGTNGLYDEAYSYNSTTGNLASKAGVNYTYSTTHKHAVAGLSNGNSYSYDDNGNMTTRNVDGQTYTLSYDAENRLVSVSGAATANYVYDGDGKQIKSVVNGVTTFYVGNHYEVKSSLVTKYYFAGSTRVAVRKYVIPQNMTLEYLLGDHLGSTSITTNTVGTRISELRYKAWGETRYTWTNAPANTSPVYELVKYQYTGQYSYDAEFGLKFYGARFYDGSTGRFISADTVIPLGTQGYDRFAYTNNNPLRYADPSGHCPICIGIGLILTGGLLFGGDTPMGAAPSAEALATAQARKAIESLSKSATTDVEKLTSMFSGNSLSGDTPKARLDSVLAGTSSLIHGLNMQFNGDFGDSGFAPQFQDGQDQVGHFLTAVGIGYSSGDNAFGISTIVGHEMLPDYGGITAPSQILIGMMSPAEREAFMSGTEGGFQQIYDSGFGFKASFGIFGRSGNSMEDIRLSYWGWYLGMLIANGCFQSNEEVAVWIEDHIANGSTELSSCLH
ncbi:MAG: RHS repeat-associated core domain-containing protein [Anaerolineales bacterium]|nr:MAG: RHS repeat-associated core domain-containing protein [Anaerolineales bacterium]